MTTKEHICEDKTIQYFDYTKNFKKINIETKDAEKSIFQWVLYKIKSFLNKIIEYLD